MALRRGRALLLRLFPRKDLPKAMLLSSMTVMLGQATGPNIGGFISDNFSWHWIFLINIPLAALLICAAAGASGTYYTYFVCFFLVVVGLAVFGHDGKMVTYGALVLVAASV